MTHEVVWKPPRDGSTNVERFMAAHAVESFDALVTSAAAGSTWRNSPEPPPRNLQTCS